MFYLVCYVIALQREIKLTPQVAYFWGETKQEEIKAYVQGKVKHEFKGQIDRQHCPE